MMAQQKEHKPGQQSGGSGERYNQPQRRDQTNPAQSDRDREQKKGQGDREKRQDQAQPGERQNPSSGTDQGRDRSSSE
jgi:hypothetical protein